MAADTGTGATISFGTTSWTGQIESIDVSGIDREVVATSHLGTTGGMTFIPGKLYNPGEISLTVLFNQNNTPPPYNSAPETITITFPDSNTFAASGFVSSTGFSVPLEDRMEQEITIKLTGNITWAAPSPPPPPPPP